MNQKEAEANKWRCPDCGTPLEESRGVYYCPALLCKTNKKIAEVFNDCKKA